MKMPTPDGAVIQRRAEIVEALQRIVPGEGVIVSEAERRAYESDGLTAYRQIPLIVVLPSTVEQVAAVLRYCKQTGIKVVPRGAGTSLSGGALPLADGVLLGMAKFNRILEIDYDNRCVVVQPGVTNLGISKAVEHAGFYYAPDPSSQIACTIGGNVAENSGGVHCLKYGLTTNNVLGIEMVLINGEVVRLGGKHLDAEGYDLLGVMTGSEGLLIVELDGPAAEVDHLIQRVEQIARANQSVSLRVSSSEEERLAFWAGRKAAFPAVGRISPDYYCVDGTIPRKRLPDVLTHMRTLSEKHGLRVANVFHAGDGNLHPLILYDANNAGELERAEEFGADILRFCVEVGGVLTGEHGVGVEKRDLMPTMFNEIDLNQQQRLKCAFDPEGLLNPGKVFPQLHRCAELGRVHIHRGQVAFPDLPRY